MIELTTGTPGAGKTLYTLWLVENRRQKENREVYYYGINSLNLPWHLLDDDPRYITDAKPATFGLMVTDWFKLPKGSIIVIDECQRLFRTRANGSVVPQFVAELETHRHHGFDIYLITQHPSLIDVNVRRLVETHRHLMRKFGAAWSTVHEWKGTKDNCDKSRADSIRSEFKFPKHVYSWYKSAEAHTAKIRIPAKVILLIIIPFVLAAIGYRFYSKFANPPESKSPQVYAAGQSAIPFGNNAQPLAKTQAEQHKPENMHDYMAAARPRFPELPYSAPKYDELTRPVIAPVYQGCVIATRDGERLAFCYLQGGVKRSVSPEFAQNFIDSGGVFIDFYNGQSSDQTLQTQRANGGTEQSDVRGAAPT